MADRADRADRDRMWVCAWCWTWVSHDSQACTRCGRDIEAPTWKRGGCIKPRRMEDEYADD